MISQSITYELIGLYSSSLRCVAGVDSIIFKYSGLLGKNPSGTKLTVIIFVEKDIHNFMLLIFLFIFFFCKLINCSHKTFDHQLLTVLFIQMPILHESLLFEREEGLSMEEKIEAQLLYEKEKCLYDRVDHNLDLLRSSGSQVFTSSSQGNFVDRTYSSTAHL